MREIGEESSSKELPQSTSVKLSSRGSNFIGGWRGRLTPPPRQGGGGKRGARASGQALASPQTLTLGFPRAWASWGPSRVAWPPP
jgi:hypothetical protein